MGKRTITSQENDRNSATGPPHQRRPGEDPAAFHALLDHHFRTYRPAGPIEE